jgi:drug/metabolite transporter (DMT)-like permease
LLRFIFFLDSLRLNTTDRTTESKSWLIDFVLLGATWGSSFLFTRLAVVDFGALPSAGMRVVIGAAVLLVMLYARRQLSVLGIHWRKTFFVGLLNSAIPFACFAWALLTITTGLSSILNATVPLFGALVAWIWVQDRPGNSRAAGLVIGFAGVSLLAWDKSGLGSMLGDGTAHGHGPQILAVLLACLCYGIAASFTKLHLTHVPPIVTAAGSQCGAALALVAPMVWLWPAQNPGVRAWIAIAISGIACTGLAYILYFRLIRRVGPARAMTVTFLIPVFAVLMGVLFLGEVVTPWMLGCGMVIVCGTALSTGLVTLPRRL